MKKLLALGIIIISLCFVSTNSFGALSSTIVWECRTTGNANNSGGYKTGATGTDYSQQANPQYALTTATTAAANAIILDASAATNMVGNVLYIVSGTNFTVGYYEIISIVAGVSITVDRNCTTAAGALGVINIGGATNHPNTISTVVVAGNTIYIAGGTYQPVGANAYVLAQTVSSGNGTPISWVGYTGARAVATGTDRPLFDANAQTKSLTAAAGNIIKNIRFANASAAGVTTNYSTFYNCASYSNGTTGFTINNGSSHIFNCEAYSNTTIGFSLTSNSAPLLFCYSHDNTTVGISCAATENIFISNCISESNSSHGINAYNGSIINCVLYNNTGAATDGYYNNVSAATHLPIINTISTSNGQYGFNRTSTAKVYASVFDYNCYNGNGTAGLNNITAGANDTTSNPLFTTPATGDFTLQSGSPCLATGSDASDLTTGVTGDYKTNIGVDQSKPKTWSYGSIN